MQTKSSSNTLIRLLGTNRVSYREFHTESLIGCLNYPVCWTVQNDPEQWAWESSTGSIGWRVGSVHWTRFSKRAKRPIANSNIIQQVRLVSCSNACNTSTTQLAFQMSVHNCSLQTHNKSLVTNEPTNEPHLTSSEDALCFGKKKVNFKEFLLSRWWQPVKSKLIFTRSFHKIFSEDLFGKKFSTKTFLVHQRVW